MGSLDSRTIVITGGSLGIGLAVSKKCAEEGAKVVIAARNARDLAAAKAELDAISSAGHLVHPLDVSNFDAVKDFAAWAKRELGTIQGLVNCAGVYGPIGKTTEIDLNAFKQAIEINFLGTVAMCHFFGTLIEGRPRKKIVNYSGGGAATPFPNYSAYATSKAAIVRFTENLARELEDEGADVNCIAPGFVVTRLHEQTMSAGADVAGDKFFQATQKQVNDGGVPPEKAADLTAFLLSAKSDGITGKFLSAPWDPWTDEDFQARLRESPDLATLRRIDDKYFVKK